MFDDAIQTYTVIKWNEETKKHVYGFMTYLGYTIEEAQEEGLISYTIHEVKDPSLTNEEIRQLIRKQLNIMAYIDTLRGYEEGCSFLVHVDLDEDWIRVGIQDYIINDFEIPKDDNYFLWCRLKQVCQNYFISCCWLHPYADNIIFRMPYLMDAKDPEDENDPLNIWQDLYGFLNYKERMSKRNAKRRKKPDPVKFKKRLF